MRMTDFDELDKYLSTSYDNRAEKPTQNFHTTDLFSSIKDSDLIKLFTPIRGIDYDPTYLNEKNQSHRMIPHLNLTHVVKAELFKNVIPQHREREVTNFQPPNLSKQAHEIPPQLRVGNDKKITNAVEKSVPSSPCDVKTVNGMTTMQADVEEMNSDVEKVEQDVEKKEEHMTLPTKDRPISDAKELKRKIMDDVSKQESRQITKRKARTYKYSPKPLQQNQKVNRAFVPDDLKNVDYWERRKRNNEAAKKSRKERREKELEIVNNNEEMRRENVLLKARNAVLESKIKELKEQNLLLCGE